MAKLFVSVFVFALFAYCSAEPARFRSFRTNRFSARQEAAPADAPPPKAPYPPAGLKPDVPFELPTETTTTPPQPDNTYLPPDNTYLPPQSVPDSSYGPPTTDASTTPLPEFDTEEPEIVVEEDDDAESVISIAVSYDDDNALAPTPQRIVYLRPRKSEKLRKLRAQPIRLRNGSIVFSG